MSLKTNGRLVRSKDSDKLKKKKKTEVLYVMLRQDMESSLMENLLEACAMNKDDNKQKTSDE